MLQFSLVFMLQERGPRQKTRLMTDIITFGVGNSTILNQDGKMKILSYVACFYSKCLAKIKNERSAWQYFLTIYSKTISLRRGPSFCDRVRLNPHEYNLSNLLLSIARTFFLAVTAIDSELHLKNIFNKPYKLCLSSGESTYVRAKPPQKFLARYWLSWQDLCHIAQDLFYLVVNSPRAQLELVYLADISFILVRSILSRRDLCDILRFDEISPTMGTRAFSRVRREFSVLPEGRHLFGYRPKPRRLDRNRKPC